MNYLREQMLFDDSLHYHWGEEGHITGDNEILDRSNGTQVLQFINRFAADHCISECAELQEIEFLLRYGTPSSAVTITEISELIKGKLERQEIPAV